MRRFAAILALVALLAPRLTPGEEGFVFVAPEPAPAKAADLRWRFNEKDVKGVFLTADQEVVVGTRILTCQKGLDLTLDKAARCEVALIQARGDVTVGKAPWWLWLVIGAGVGAGGALVVRGATK